MRCGIIYFNLKLGKKFIFRQAIKALFEILVKEFENNIELCAIKNHIFESALIKISPIEDS